MLNKKFLLIGIGFVLVIATTWWYLRSRETVQSDVIIHAKKGKFEVSVTVTGELQATNSIDIKGPEGAEAEGIWQMKIAKLIPEGTVVKQGEWVADLDKSDIAGKLKDAELAIQKAEALYTQTSLDSALTLSNARDEITNLKSTQEERKLDLEQSKFEPPASVRRAEISYQSSERQLKQATENYQTKLKQAAAKMQQANADLSKERRRYDQLAALMAQFTVKAPSNGMVIYGRSWDGRKKVVGSQVSSWNPTVATLPDLTKMESLTYVNEVDIQKIKKEQWVAISLDAQPNKKLSGKVISVANIGEQRPNSDSKVFEVRIEVFEKDTTLRPAMTTSNRIVAATVDNVLSVPLECIHTENGKTYIYCKDGSKVVKQEVKVGLLSENDAIIEKGISESSEIFLSLPTDYANASVNFLK